MQLAKEMVVPSFAQQRSGEEKHPKPRTNNIQKHAINNDSFFDRVANHYFKDPSAYQAK